MARPIAIFVLKILLFAGCLAEDLVRCCDRWRKHKHYFICIASKTFRCPFSLRIRNSFDCCSTEVQGSRCPGEIQANVPSCPAYRTFSSAYFCHQGFLNGRNDREIWIRSEIPCTRSNSIAITYLCCAKYKAPSSAPPEVQAFANDPVRNIQGILKSFEDSYSLNTLWMNLRCNLPTYEDQPCERHNFWPGPKHRHCIDRFRGHVNLERPVIIGPMLPNCRTFLEQMYPGIKEGESELSPDNITGYDKYMSSNLKWKADLEAKIKRKEKRERGRQQFLREQKIHQEKAERMALGDLGVSNEVEIQKKQPESAGLPSQSAQEVQNFAPKNLESITEEREEDLKHKWDMEKQMSEGAPTAWDLEAMQELELERQENDPINEENLWVPISPKSLTTRKSIPRASSFSPETMQGEDAEETKLYFEEEAGPMENKEIDSL